VDVLFLIFAALAFVGAMILFEFSPEDLIRWWVRRGIIKITKISRDGDQKIIIEAKSRRKEFIHTITTQSESILKLKSTKWGGGNYRFSRLIGKRLNVIRHNRGDMTVEMLVDNHNTVFATTDLSIDSINLETQTGSAFHPIRKFNKWLHT
jgi:hypothetical protein